MSGSGGIQTSVNTLQSPAVEGDWCDSNPRYSVDAGPFGLVSGAAGLTIGRFAWLDPTALDANGYPSLANNFGFGSPAGFVHREQQAQIVTFLADSSMLIQPGNNITLTSAGGVWARNNGASEAQFGMKAFADLATGRVSFAAAGTVFGGASATTSSIAAATFSVTGSVAGNVLTVTAVGSGTVVPGGTISGTGIATGTQVVNQLTGTPGGIGTYTLNVGEQTAASTTVSGTYGILTIGTATGTFVIGDVLTGTNVVAGTSITANLTGAGGTGGTMVVNNNTIVNSTTITASTSVETSFVARSTGLTGELVKITNQLVP
jgi:hypothetical protein